MCGRRFSGAGKFCGADCAYARARIPPHRCRTCHRLVLIPVNGNAQSASTTPGSRTPVVAAFGTCGRPHVLQTVACRRRRSGRSRAAATRCAQCSVLFAERPGLPESPELHHVVPLTAGELHVPSNVQMICRRCHQFSHSHSELRALIERARDTATEDGAGNVQVEQLSCPATFEGGRRK